MRARAFNHPKFHNGIWIYTDPILWLFQDKNILVTQNFIYKLGEIDPVWKKTEEAKILNDFAS